MSLSPQTVEVALAQSIDLKTDPKLVDAQHMLTMNNVRFTSANAVDKRLGQSKLPTKTNVQDPLNVSVVTTSSKNLLTYNESTCGDATGTATEWVFINGLNSYNTPIVGTGTLTVVTSTAAGAPFQGTKALHFTTSGNNGQGAAVLQVPCQPNTQYTFSAYECDSSGGNVFLGLCDNTGTSNGVNHSTPSNTWTRISATLTTSNTATMLQIGVNLSTRVVGDQDIYLDAWQLELGSGASTWAAGAGATTTYTTYQPHYITQGKALAKYGSELLAYDGSNLFGYSQSAQTWLNRGAVTEVSMKDSPIGLGQFSAQGYASALSGNYMAYAWDVAGGGCYYSIQDLQTGNLVVPATLMPQSVSTPQVFVYNNDFYFIYLGTAAIMGIRINGGQPWAGPINGEYVYLNGVYSALAVAQSTKYLYIAYVNSRNNVNVVRADLALDVVTAPTNITTGLAFPQLSASIANGQFLIMVAEPSVPSEISVWGVDLTSLAQVSRVTFAAPDPSWVFDGMYITGLLAYGTFGRQVCVYLTDTTSPVGVQPSVGIPSNLRPASSFVAVGSTTYGVFVTPQVNILGALSQQATYYLCTVSAVGLPSPVFRFYSDAAGSFGPLYSVPNLAYSAGTFYLGASRKTALRADASGTVYAQDGIYGVQLTFPTQSSMTAQEAYGSALINIGNTYSYDGSILVEDGFWEFPDGLSATIQPGAGSLSAGAYFYQATYEWVDAAGNVHYSAPSYALEVVVSASAAVQVIVPYTALTLKPNATVNLYRSAANTSSPLYKIGSFPNLLSSGTVTFSDALADSQIEGQQFLYAPQDGSGELENDPPPPFRYLTLTKTRAFGIPQDDPFALWYSKPLLPGRPVEWSSAQIIQIERQGGTPSGLGYVDTYAIVFKTQRIYYLFGDGPNAGGGGSQYGALQTISATTGCINNAATINATDGCYFVSSTGLSLIQKGSLDPHPTFGLPVQPLIQSLALSAGVIVPGQNTLRWISTTGAAVIYDYLLQKWYTFDNYAAVGATQWNSTMARLQANGVVYYEDPTTYLDDGHPVTMTVETSYLKLGQLTQGYAAVWYAMILGIYRDSHDLTIQVTYDYLDAPSQTYVFHAGAVGNLGAFGSGTTYGQDPLYGANIYPAYSTAYQPRLALQRQTCQAIKFTMTDSKITGRSATLNVLALELGVVGGLNRTAMRTQV